MSTLQTYIDDAMIAYWIDAQQYKPAQQVRDANVVYHKIEDFIVHNIWEWFFWDIATVEDTVANQNEYTFPVIPSWNFDSVQKIENISIKYETNGKFYQATPINRETITEDLSELNERYSEVKPVYFIADNSYFIFPAPKEAIAEAIKIYGIKWLRDVTASTTDANLFGWKIPKKYYSFITEGLEEFILRKQGKRAEAEEARQIFERDRLPRLAERLWNRKIWITLRQPINVSKYYGK